MKLTDTVDRQHRGAMFRLAAAFVIAAAIMRIHAAINYEFSSTQFGTNLQSDGSAMDNTFTFELGTFAAGFTPTSGNTDQWLANWSPVTDGSGAALAGATTQFGTIDSFFGPYEGFRSSVELEHNNDPFAIGSQGYVWGFTGRDEGTEEWILFTNDSAGDAWQFGDTSVLGFPGTWESGGANNAIIGEVNFLDSKDDFIAMQSAEVTLGPVVPEPATGALLACAGIAFAARRRRPGPGAPPGRA